MKKLNEIRKKINMVVFNEKVMLIAFISYIFILNTSHTVISYEESLNSIFKIIRYAFYMCCLKKSNYKKLAITRRITLFF